MGRRHSLLDRWFVRIMEAREEFCRSEAARLSDRARTAAGKVERSKNMVLYYLMSRDLKAIEGREFTLRAQKNSQDSGESPTRQLCH